MKDINCLLYMGAPWITDWFGGRHAQRVRFFCVVMGVPEALRHLPNAIRIIQVTRN